MNDQWYDRMKSLYRSVDEQLKKNEKECGSCVSCCPFAKIPYREIEYDFILEYLMRTGRTELYEELIKLGPTWGQTGKTCMFLKREGKNCSIHEVRPYNCRVFGPYSDEEIGLPAKCVYEGATIKMPRDKVTELLPLFKEYHKLASEYSSFWKDTGKEKENAPS
ncbi:MAG: YkgJ family cysteine cluster protein [Candidatus Eremiobacteraeota bacterium]|nr:YkgJ family cysteine cluster protein [Candidatus Eremiobacteraeota bacterium]